VTGPFYTTWGPVRGECGHRHNSVRAAARCCVLDRRYCERSRGSYSDRSLWRVDTVRGGGRYGAKVRFEPSEQELLDFGSFVDDLSAAGGLT